MARFLCLVAGALLFAFAGATGATADGSPGVCGVWAGDFHSDMNPMGGTVELFIQQQQGANQFDWEATSQGGLPAFTGHGTISEGKTDMGTPGSIWGESPDGMFLVHAHG